jgi:predicted methyltransferase MtxX (methanogen marker protein 4)
MGRMKEVYIQVLQANNGIPEDMTVGDFLRMTDLNIYHWQEYERAQERARLQSNKQTDLGEATENSEGKSIRREENS